MTGRRRRGFSNSRTNSRGEAGSESRRSEEWNAAMATFKRSKSSDKPLTDLLPVLRSSKILNDRQVDEIRNKIDRGEYPADPTALAERLIRDQLITPYQARRLLSNKPYGLVVGRYIILDRIGSG